MKLKAIINPHSHTLNYSLIFDNSPVASALVSPTGMILRSNKRLSDLLGFPTEQLEMLSINDIQHPEYFNVDEKFITRLDYGYVEYFQIEKQLITRRGNLIWCTQHVSKMTTSSGSISYLIYHFENIHERKRKELQLKEEKQRLENVIDATDIGTWEYNLETEEVKYNERWAQIIGYTLEELSPITAQTRNQLTHQDDLVESNRQIDLCKNNLTDSYDLESRMKHKKGHWVWVLDRGKVLSRHEDGKPIMMFGTHTDITELKSTQEIIRISNKQLIQEKAFIQTLLNTINVGIVACDEEGLLTLFNTATKELHGLPNKPIPPEQWAEHYNLYEADGITPLLKENIPLFQALITGTVTNNHIAIVPQKGNKKIISVSGGQIIDKNGSLHGAVVAMQDITQQCAHEESLNKLNVHLEKVNANLAFSNKELESFAYVASHDLQEPLRMIASFLQLLDKKYKDVLDEKANKYISYAVDGATRMQQMILDLLEYSKAGRSLENSEKVNLNDILKDIVVLHSRQISESGATLSVRPLPNVLCHKAPLKQILQNLINNSLKYCKKNEPLKLDIFSEEFKDHWEITIKDNGLGIDPKYFDRIFTIFERLHNKQEYSGTGIGLAIVKRIIESLGEKIWVNSKVGVGSAFTFTLSKSHNS